MLMNLSVYSFFKFLGVSTNHHGVHSPFVYEFLTKGLYKKQNCLTYGELKSICKTYDVSKKSIEITCKTIQYFEVKTILCETNTASMLKKIAATTATAHTISYTPEYLPSIQMICMDISTFNYEDLKAKLVTNPLPNDCVIVLNQIRKNKNCYVIWNNIAQLITFTVAIDMFYTGLLFVRREQQKEHFYIRY